MMSLPHAAGELDEDHSTDRHCVNPNASDEGSRAATYKNRVHHRRFAGINLNVNSECWSDQNELNNAIPQMMLPPVIPTYQPHPMLLSPSPIMEDFMVSPTKKRKAQYFTLPFTSACKLVDQEVDVDSPEMYEYFGRPLSVANQDLTEQQAMLAPFSIGSYSQTAFEGGSSSTRNRRRNRQNRAGISLMDQQSASENYSSTEHDFHLRAMEACPEKPPQSP
ncbi:hypothetical protein TorRG33x02_096380 [Trema orientale]|uniref:Uncharacterized protein n=1 Tax=Trema orientale TaxID=63057 RepID=A0A2P5FA02_TREOI|nr:hypothetical protein TorRG33x02_096380 [Trema orientale]